MSGSRPAVFSMPTMMNLPLPEDRPIGPETYEDILRLESQRLRSGLPARRPRRRPVLPS